MCALWAVIPGHGMLRPRGGHMPVMHTPHVCPMSRHEPWPWHAKATWLVTEALLDTTTGLLDMTIWKVSLKVSDVGCMCLRDVSDYVSCVSDEPYPYPYKVALSL